MTTITISKNKYQSLLSQANAYKKLAASFASAFIEKPITDVVENFRSTEKYSKEFLLDLEDGLKDLRNKK